MDGLWQLEKFKHFVEKDIDKLGLGDVKIELFDNLRKLVILAVPISVSVCRTPPVNGYYKLTPITASREYVCEVFTGVTPNALCFDDEKFLAWVKSAVDQIRGQAALNNEPMVLGNELAN